MTSFTFPTDYYQECTYLQDPQQLEKTLQEVLAIEINSISELEAWLQTEQYIYDEITEAMTGHQIDFLCDMTNLSKQQQYEYDQQVVQPLLTTYYALFDQKICDHPLTSQLNDSKYGLMRHVRQTQLQLFCTENIPLVIQEQEHITAYRQLIGHLTVEWEGEMKPYAFAQAQVDHGDRTIREQAWRAIQQAFQQIEPQIHIIMDQLIQLRHQIAINAGFANYRDYIFVYKNREYRIQDCLDYHQSVATYLVPAWDRLAKVLQQQLAIESYRPWDIGLCAMQGAPFEDQDQWLDRVEQMLSETDTYFGERFQHMRAKGLLDVDNRQGKSAGAFCDPLPRSQESFIFSNFSPSFVALIALIHEVGHAIHNYLKLESEESMQLYHHREEIAELYSHSMELLLLDKLSIAYADEQECRHAQRELLHRAMMMLIKPLSSDQFQHWMYTHPNHTHAERQAEYLRICQSYIYHPVDIQGLESEVSIGWMSSAHYIAYPFYNIEYAMAQLGALQLLDKYQQNPSQAISEYKQGARSNPNQSISQIYKQTGVQFDFSSTSLQQTAEMIERLLK